MIKGVIFDLDGTLLNTLNDLHNAVCYALSNNGIKTFDISYTKDYIGNGIKMLITRALKHNNLEFDEKVFNDFKKYYSNHQLDYTIPYEGILDVLNNLKKLGYKTAIVSNKHQEGVSSLGKRFFNNNIDVLIGSLETIKLKPHPDMLLLACDKLSLKVDECIFVGDSDVDMITANNANMKVVGVTWGFRDEKVLKENNATYIINTPNELLDLIKEK
ncbi:MAG: HAD family hydrolase [Bacilli bacterium]|nr:HAD family hydrolase [Bacilli bacterium]